jgi:pathogenesis-related protein 1
MLLISTACGDSARSVDDDGGTGNPTSSSGAGAGSAMETGALMGITDAHNQVRQGVDTATPIPDLQWSASIAGTAQAYADQLASAGCPLQHSGGDYGENLFWGTANYSPSEVVGGWAGEAGCFTYTNFPDSCGCECGHYTQIVWRATTQLGCGIGACPDGGEVWVCNYDPPGNYIGEMPY